MNEEKKPAEPTVEEMRLPQFLQRYGGHLILLIVAALLVLLARTTSISDLFSVDQSLDGTGGVFEEFAAADAEQTDAEPDESEDEIVVTALPEAIDLSIFPILIDSSLAPALNPRTFEGILPFHTSLFTYTVERNDTPFDLAFKFEIREETLLGCNPRLSEESSLMQVGDELIICPIDGVLHDVGRGESVESIAIRYGVSESDIIDYSENKLEFPYRLYEGTQIFVPGAVREIFVWTPPEIPASSGGTAGGGAFAALGSLTYIWPVQSRNISQYYSYFHPGLDIALPEGNAVFASDHGTVSYAGWNNTGYGNLVVVNHGRGISTYYAHLSAIYVFVGQVVSQGEVVAATGNTGRSSGPHIHFEIRSSFGQERNDPLWPGYLP